MRKCDPSPEEIKERCWRIQGQWSEPERQRRAGCYAVAEVIRIPVGIDLGDSFAIIDVDHDHDDRI